jgi:hypothetical protein
VPLWAALTASRNRAIGLLAIVLIDFIWEVRPQDRVSCRVLVAFAASLFWLTTVFAEDVICPNDEESDRKHLAVSLTTEYDNKYVFRGVNSLPGSGIATFDANFEFQHFSFEIWQARGLSKSYDEFDFTLEYAYEVQPFIFAGGYINYYTPNDDHLGLGYRDTQEIFASIEVDIGSRYTATLKYNYDFDKIHGGFIEPRFVVCFPLPNNKVAFDPYVSITYDLQYNSDSFAWNNFQSGIEVVWKVTDELTLSAVTEVSVPLAAIDQFAKKEAWIGLRITADF